MTIQSIQPLSVIQWGRAGAACVLRSSVEYLVLFGLVLCVYASNHFSSTDTITLFLLPLIFGIGCITAKAAANGVSVYTLYQRIPLVVFGRLLLLGLVPWIVFAILGKLFDSVFYKISVLFFMEQSIHHGNILHSMTVDLLLWFFVCGSLCWFIVPLVVVENYTLTKSFSMAWSALRKNHFILTLNMIFALVLALTLLVPILVAPFFAVTSAMMYFSYSQVYRE